METNKRVLVVGRTRTEEITPKIAKVIEIKKQQPHKIGAKSTVGVKVVPQKVISISSQMILNHNHFPQSNHSLHEFVGTIVSIFQSSNPSEICFKACDIVSNSSSVNSNISVNFFYWSSSYPKPSFIRIGQVIHVIGKWNPEKGFLCYWVSPADSSDVDIFLLQLHNQQVEI